MNRNPSFFWPLVLMALVTLTAPPQAMAAAPVVRRAAQVSRNDRADVTFEVRPGRDGIEVSGRSGSLQVTKTVQPTGEFTLDLAADRDRVTLAATSKSLVVTRGKSRVTLLRNQPNDAAGEQVRRLLADSSAVYQFRATSAALLDAEDRSGASLAFLMADAALGALAGDAGAPRRVARFLAHTDRPNARQAGLRSDCFYEMETQMVAALTNYAQCMDSVWNNYFWSTMCSWQWVLQVESYWFSFIACSGLNW